MGIDVFAMPGLMVYVSAEFVRGADDDAAGGVDPWEHLPEDVSE